MFKRDTTGRFDESKHARDGDGRFAPKAGGDTAPSIRQRQLVERSPGRLLEEKWRPRGAALFNQGKSTPPGNGHNTRSSWERLGNKIAELPPSYTGSRDREAPVDGYRTFAVTWQKPKAMSAKENNAVRTGLVGTIKSNRDGAVEMATERGLIGDGTPRGLVNRAYNLAAMRALHEYGVLAFDYTMGDDLKREMAPLEPAMRYFQRRIGNSMRSEPATKGKWQAYKEEFGVSTGKLDRRPGKGNQLRLKWRKSQGQHTQFIKATMPGELLKGIDPGIRASLAIADQIIADAETEQQPRRRSTGALAPEVEAILPMANRIISDAGVAQERMAPHRLRHRVNEHVIRDPRRSLAELLG